MALPKTSKNLRIFESHGVHFTGESGDQVYGYCPFSQKDDKFYVNTETLLWDSKTANLSGNVHDFLKHTSQRYRQAITPELLARLATDRGLPRRAFAPWEVGWTGKAYTIPVRNVRGRITDIRLYTIGGRMMGTAGASVGLLGAPMIAKHPSWPIYLCEGEWDAIALQWLAAHLEKEAVVVAVPGAGTFKPEWVAWLSGRRVHTLYDHDGAGEKGEHVALDRLKNRVHTLTFTHWPDALPEGFDVRDWIVEGAIKRKTPKRCWNGMHKLFNTAPRRTVLEDKKENEEDAGSQGPEAVAPPRESKWKQPPSLDDVYTVFKKWLYLDSTDALDIMLATYISQQIDGEPVWMFIVGPPGSAKTETLSSLSWLDSAYMTSSVTPHSLISGANWKDQNDPSLIPKLDGKVMVIKDFTSILSMRDTDKDEIFGILRDAFDGKCGKEFGNGVVRKYESRFTVLAAVTPSIYALSSTHTALGERFLKFGIGDNLVHQHEDAIIDRAITNINRETSMRDDLADVVHAFLSRRIGLEKIPLGALPELPDEIRQKIIALARFGARMRGSVTRDTYRNDIVTSRPSAEVATRLGKQLAKLCQALAVLHGRRAVTIEDYRLVKKVMLDTIPQRTEDVLRNILLTCPGSDDTISTTEVSNKTRYPQATISRILQDLTVLDITNRKVGKINGHAHNSQWSLSGYIRGLIQKSGLYNGTRPVRKLKVRKMRHQSESHTAAAPAAPRK